jgi:hypothetical protein
MMVVIVMCTLFLGVIAGWVSRGAVAHSCGKCGLRLMCLRCISDVALTAARQSRIRIPR